MRAFGSRALVAAHAIRSEDWDGAAMSLGTETAVRGEQEVHMPVEAVKELFSGVTLTRPMPRHAPDQEIFGHVELVEGYALPDFTGCHALVALRDTPGKVVAVLTTEIRLQALLETALAKNYLIAFWGYKMTNPPTPRGGTWAVEVYQIDGVILYNGA